MNRVLAFPLVRLALVVALFAMFAMPTVRAARSIQSPWVGVALGWLLAALLFAALIAVERVIAGKSLGVIGFAPQGAERDLVLGVGLGAVLFSLVVLELFLGGCYRVTATRLDPNLAAAALLLLGGAVFEELLFRGTVFRLLEEWTGTWIALAISALIFGLAHAANPHATWLSSLAIALEAGVLLGAAYVVTRNLWFPIGVHFAWNFAEGPLYGAAISGHAVSRSVLVPQLSGPAAVTGGAFGPEAGTPAIATCAAAAAVLLVVVVRRGGAQPPAWRRAPRTLRSHT